MPVPTAPLGVRRLAAVLALTGLAVLLPGSSAAAQEVGSSPEPSPTGLLVPPVAEPSAEPSPEPTSEPVPEPEPVPSPTRVRRAPSPQPTAAVAEPSPSPSDEPSPTPTAAATPSAAPVVDAELAGPAEAVEASPEPVAEVASSAPADPVTRYLTAALVLAVLLGAAGGTGLYLTREHR